MNMVVLRNAKRDLRSWLLHRPAHRNIDPPLEFTNVLGVSIDAAAVAGAEVSLESSKFVRYRIQNAGILLSSRQPLFGIRSITEQALESHARVDLRRKRLRGGRPGYGVGVGAAIAPVAIAEIGSVLHTELDGGQYRVLAVLIGDQLIDGNTQVRTHCVSSRTGTRQQSRTLCMITAGLFFSSKGLVHIEATDENRAIPKWLQGFRDKRKFEVGTFLHRTPVAGRCAMRMPYAYEALYRAWCCNGLAQRSLCGEHRLEQRQRQRRPDTTQECAARDMFFRNKHQWPPWKLLQL